MMWIETITDRTFEDVLYARDNQSSDTFLKGSWNTIDANRIINNINYLYEKLTLYGYNVNHSPQSLIGAPIYNFQADNGETPDEFPTDVPQYSTMRVLSGITFIADYYFDGTEWVITT